MPTILVVYDSLTGNTEKMAVTIAEAAKKVENIKVILKKVDTASNNDLLGADGIIIGSPTYYGLMSGNIKSFLDESAKIHGKLDGKIGAAFTTSGGVACGAETTILSIIQAMLVHGMIVKGNSKIRHYGAAAVGLPNKEALKECEEFGTNFAKFVVKLSK